MSAIADIDAIAKTNTATAARRRNHCFIADPLIVVNSDFAYRTVLSMATATLPRIGLRHPANVGQGGISLEALVS
jgi:hypothetical protein